MTHVIYMLHLRHLALLKIDPRQTFDEHQIEIFKNLRHEISMIVREQSSILKNAMNAYDELRREYYQRLMKKNRNYLVSDACFNLVMNYNRLIDARNICSANKSWRKNFILLDEYIFRNLACPSVNSQYEELDKILIGILHSKQDLELPEEIIPIDTELLGMIHDYEGLCQTIYETMHAEDEKYSLDGFSEKLQKAVKEEDEARDKYLESSNLLAHAEELLENKDEEELLEIFTVLQNFQPLQIFPL